MNIFILSQKRSKTVRTYDRRKEFLITLNGEQKKIFDEIIELRFIIAQAISKYFCLNNENPTDLDEIAMEFRYKNGPALKREMDIVFTYLHAPFLNPSAKRERDVKTLEKRVSRERMRKAISEQFTPQRVEQILNTFKNATEEDGQLNLNTPLSSEIISLLKKIAEYKSKAFKPKKVAIKQLFLKLLGDTSKEKLFNELIDFDFLCAKIAKSYFCLDDEKFISQAELGKKYRIAQPNISTLILIVLKYLCPQFKTETRIESGVNTLRKKVAELRKEKIIPIKKFPKKTCNVSFYLLYEKVAFANNMGFLENLESRRPLEVAVLRLRFNLCKDYGRCLERPEITKILAIKSSQKVEQMEKTALYWIGINDSPIITCSCS